jgi:hypothetical protein
MPTNGDQMSLQSDLAQLLANLHGAEFASVQYLRKILRDNAGTKEVDQWAWQRIDLHAAFSEEEAREMAANSGGTVMKRTITSGKWEEA